MWYWNSYDGIFTGDVNKNEKVDLIATISHLGDKNKGDEICGKRAEEAIANAKLIASAPELLEACQEALLILNDNLTLWQQKSLGVFPMLKQAIAKVEEV